MTPTPNPSPQGGGERTEDVGPLYCLRKRRSGAGDRYGDKPCRFFRFQPHQHRALAVLLGLDHGVAHVGRAWLTFLPATSRMTSPVLKPCSEASPLGSTSVTTTPSVPLPATCPAGASIRPSFGTSCRVQGDSEPPSARLPLFRQLAEREREALLFALAPHAELRRRCRAPWRRSGARGRERP